MRCCKGWDVSGCRGWCVIPICSWVWGRSKSFDILREVGCCIKLRVWHDPLHGKKLERHQQLPMTKPANTKELANYVEGGGGSRGLALGKCGRLRQCRRECRRQCGCRSWGVLPGSLGAAFARRVSSASGGTFGLPLMPSPAWAMVFRSEVEYL